MYLFMAKNPTPNPRIRSAADAARMPEDDTTGMPRTGTGRSLRVHPATPLHIVPNAPGRRPQQKALWDLRLEPTAQHRTPRIDVPGPVTSRCQHVPGRRPEPS